MSEPKKISAVEFIKEHPTTVVFYHQPEQFWLVEHPDDLRRWENDLKEKVTRGAGTFSPLSESPCCSSNECDTD